MAKKGGPTLFNPRPSRPTLPKKEPSASNTPSPGSSQTLPTAQSQPGTPKKPPTATASPRPAPPRRPTVKTEDDPAPQMPEGPFSEYRLMSSKLNGWKYDIMKFDSRKKVEINEWSKPIYLNRKDLHREDPSAQGPKQAVAPMVGSDGKLVMGADGKVVMVDAQGKIVRDADVAAAGADDKGKGKDKEKGKKKFQKKTRQVFMIPEETRQLRREEKYPWVIEDNDKQEVWTASMEEVSRSETCAMFMPAANDVFKFVPAHRWYKFRKQPSHAIIRDLNAIENYMSKAQKLNARTLSSLVAKTELASANGTSLVHNAGQSRGPLGRKLRTVDSGPSDLFGDDDDDEGGDSKRKIKRELGQEGFLDELDFEESFQDDEERMEADDNEDEETKELEERLKKEYRTANKLREGGVDESEEEEDDEAKLTGAGKNLQKTLKKLEKGGGYEDSDDEKNPYASSEEEEEEEEPPQVPNGPAILPPEPKPGLQRSPSQTPSAGPAPGAKPGVNGQGAVAVKTEPQSPSRATSPVPGPPNHGGHSIVAKRATSPKVPKPKAGIPGRAGSPLATPNGVSPAASRAASPVAANGPGAAASPGGKPLKRKATEDGAAASTDGAPRQKKRKAPAGELEDRMVIEWLRNTPNATTRECIQHFTKYLTDETKKSKFTALVKEVAQLSGGVLILRPAYRGTTGASPAPAPAAA
ncbi:hypothetical protein K466DRAFT_582462 [Polyporus arcularius HHB13444]|uniref:Uncharacterized protein n=1 Tax=Polyporus arcularius HHB13444 TaxID=1314778 RepID=A0A5C3PQT7_9APHY|nr:hypothetical protein K466DRAFT_582462 [Polyporus arcularius HHB13444]